MSLLAAIPFLLLIVLCVGCAVYYAVVAARAIRAGRIPTARDGLDLELPPGEPGNVCVVIPAHNEEEEIGGLVRSLLAQDYPRLHIVLALDRCTDATERAAREAAGGDRRVEIVEISECPPGWAGKVHAVHAGLTASKAAPLADYLLFADADTRFHPGCIRATVALLHQRELDMLSLLSTLTCVSWFERVVQPAAGFELTRDGARLVVFALVFGLGYGGSFTMIQLTCVECFGQQALGKLLGIIIFVDSLGAAAGTFVSGRMSAASGSYLLPFMAVTAVAAVAVVSVAFVRALQAERSV